MLIYVTGAVVLASGCTGKVRWTRIDKHVRSLLLPTSQDAYGSNNCDIKWGSSNTATIQGSPYTPTNVPKRASRPSASWSCCFSSVFDTTLFFRPGGDLPEDLNSKSKITVNLHVDSIFPWDFSCAVCG